jgi:hypothetical protein
MKMLTDVSATLCCFIGSVQNVIVLVCSGYRLQSTFSQDIRAAASLVLIFVDEGMTNIFFGF